MRPVCFNHHEIRSRVAWPQLLDSIERALIAFSRGEANQPLRTVIDFPAGCLFSMPAYLSDPPALGAKLVTICSSNKTIATHQATLVMLHPETGELLALFDGGAITELRTAAASLLSVRELATPGARHLAILGAGVQARGHVEALRATRELESVRVWSPSADRRLQFARSLNVEAAISPEDAVRDADMIVLATSSSEPVLRREWVSDGAHIVSVGAPRPHQREMDPELLAVSRLYVDSRTSALAESGDIVQAIARNVIAPSHIIGELGELLAGSVPGRQSADEITIFKSLGLAVEDVATGALLLTARESGT